MPVATATSAPGRPARTGRTFYRLVGRCPPSLADFESDAERGRQPRDEQLADPRLYRGVSVWNTRLQAEPVARAARERGWTRIGRSVAALAIPSRWVGVEIHKTRGPGHLTLVATASVLYERVLPGSCRAVD